MPENELAYHEELQRWVNLNHPLNYLILNCLVDHMCWEVDRKPHLIACCAKEKDFIALYLSVFIRLVIILFMCSGPQFLGRSICISS